MASLERGRRGGGNLKGEGRAGIEDCWRVGEGDAGAGEDGNEVWFDPGSSSSISSSMSLLVIESLSVITPPLGGTSACEGAETGGAGEAETVCKGPAAGASTGGIIGVTAGTAATAGIGFSTGPAALAGGVQGVV